VKEVHLTDPNIRTTDAYTVNGCKITVPTLVPSEIGPLLYGISQCATEYFSDHCTAFEALRQTFARWSDPNHVIRQKVLPVLADVTGFSPENILCFGLMPLSELRIEADELTSVEEHVTRLIETGEYKTFTRWQNGYLKGYGSPKVIVSDRPRQILQILAGNVVGPSWLTVILGALSQTPQVIKLPSQDLVSFLLFLETLDELDPGFRRTIACGYYPSGGQVEKLLLEQVDFVTAMGSDQTIHAIEQRLTLLNRRARFVPHGFKIGFQAVSKEYARP